MWKIIKENHFELGIILANIGTQVSVITKEFLPNSSFNLTYLMFFLSLLLLFNYEVLLNHSIIKPSRIMMAVLIYNLYVMLNGLINEASITGGNDALIYTAYVILMWICVSTNTKRINTNFFIGAMWHITALYSCLLFYILTDNFRNLYGISFTFLPSGADRITLSVIGFMHLCAALTYDTRNIFQKTLKYFFAFIAFYDLMICSRRGLLVALILIIIYQFYLSYGKRTTSTKMLSFLIATTGIVVIFIISIFFYPDILLKINEYFQRLLIGLNTYLGNFSGGVDAAAVARNTVMNTVPVEYLNSSLTTVVFGNGYGYKQLDIPYLQAFTDLGLSGGIYYFFIQCLYPVRTILKKSANKSVILIKYIGIMTITYNLYSGVPYNHYKFVGLIILIYAVKQEERSKINQIYYD